MNSDEMGVREWKEEKRRLGQGRNGVTGEYRGRAGGLPEPREDPYSHVHSPF